MRQKPDWKDAPEWAKWLAMDDNGEWYWFIEKPTLLDEGDECGYWNAPFGSYLHVEVGVDWKTTLEERPQQ
jgi:hypothetical protein